MESEQTKELRRSLSAAKKALRKAGVEWAIFAGAAARCYGSKRKITDIDILVRGFDLDKARCALKNLRNIDVVADLKIRTNKSLCLFFMDDEMAKRIKYKLLLGEEVPVVPVEDNIILKAILQRGEKQCKRDIEDVQAMIKRQQINFKYLMRRIQIYNAAKRVPSLLKRLGIEELLDDTPLKNSY